MSTNKWWVWPCWYATMMCYYFFLIRPKVNIHAMLQGWWDWPSLRCSAAPAQCQGGKCLYWLQGIADTEPVWATAAPLGAPEKHSTPGTWNTGSHCRFTLEQKLKPLHTICHKMFGLHSLLKVTLCFFFGPSFFLEAGQKQTGYEEVSEGRINALLQNKWQIDFSYFWAVPVCLITKDKQCKWLCKTQRSQRCISF